MYSNQLKQQVQTPFCKGRPIKFNGKQAYIISYSSYHEGKGLFRITNALIAMEGKTIMEGKKKVLLAILLKVTADQLGADETI